MDSCWCSIIILSFVWACVKTAWTEGLGHLSKTVVFGSRRNARFKLFHRRFQVCARDRLQVRIARASACLLTAPKSCVGTVGSNHVGPCASGHRQDRPGSGLNGRLALQWADEGEERTGPLFVLCGVSDRRQDFHIHGLAACRYRAVHVCVCWLWNVGWSSAWHAGPLKQSSYIYIK